MGPGRSWIHPTRRTSATWNSRPSPLKLGASTPSRTSRPLTISTILSQTDRPLVGSKLYPSSPLACFDARSRCPNPIVPSLVWDPSPCMFFIYVYVACACRTFSSSLPPSVHHPNLFSPSHKPRLSPRLSLGTPLPHTPFPPLGILECFSITWFSSSIIRRRKVYIQAHLPVHVLYSCHHTTEVPTTTASEDLDLGFPDDAGGDPSNREARPNRHTARDVCNWICRVDSKGQDQISQTNQLLHEVLSLQRDSRQDLVMGM